MFQAVQDKPMIVRLLDPPMHEFLPKDFQEIEILATKLKNLPENWSIVSKVCKKNNPMLGHRGCRLGITKPEIYKMQTEAILRVLSSYISKVRRSNLKSWFL